LALALPIGRWSLFAILVALILPGFVVDDL